MTHRCNNDECPACETAAERMAEPEYGPNDWQIGQNAYEREMDERWS